LIRKTTDAGYAPNLRTKAYFPNTGAGSHRCVFCAISRSHGLVYLTWTKLPCPPDPKAEAADQPTLGKISSSDVKLSERYQFRRCPKTFDAHPIG
jgi:hypothetical protein